MCTSTLFNPILLRLFIYYCLQFIHFGCLFYTFCISMSCFKSFVYCICRAALSQSCKRNADCFTLQEENGRVLSASESVESSNLFNTRVHVRISDECSLVEAEVVASTTSTAKEGELSETKVESTAVSGDEAVAMYALAIADSILMDHGADKEEL